MCPLHSLHGCRCERVQGISGAEAQLVAGGQQQAASCVLCFDALLCHKLAVWVYHSAWPAG